MRTALECEDRSVARRIIQQFVAKIVIKEGTGTCSRAFPFPDDLYMPSFCDLDMRVSVPLTRHILHFDIPLPASTESDLRNPDKAQLRADILAMRADGMSYRRIARAVGLHWTRVRKTLLKGL